MDTLDAPPSYAPPPPPSKKASRPKITLQIPDSTVPTTPRGPPTAASVYWGSTRYRGRPPTTPASHISDPHGNPYFSPFGHMYQNKASEFMFKQFEGFKDFTMETAKSGLSAGEKSAFWFVNKLKSLSKKWFTHLFLTLCLVLYSLVGAAVFLALEGANEKQEQSKYNYTLEEVRREAATKLHEAIVSQRSHLFDGSFDLLSRIEHDIRLYEEDYSDYVNNVKNKKTWTFWNSMFYAGTIFTTIGMYMRERRRPIIFSL